MGIALLFFSIFGLLLTLGLLFTLLLKKKVTGLHEIWDLAISGDRLSRIYCLVAIVSFICAVLSVLFIKMEI